MITAEQVKNLNKKIEGLNAQGNRAKAKLEVLEGNLTQSLEDYSNAYGVNLRGKTMKATATNIQKELAAVEADVQKEFELREAVVAAIERGDIDEANCLLGVEVVEEPDEDEDAPEEDAVAEEGVVAEEDAVAEEPSAPVTPASADDEDDFGIEDDEDGFSGIDGDGTVGDGDDTTPASFNFGGLDFGDLSLGDDDEDEAPAPAPKAGGKTGAKTGGKSVGKTGGKKPSNLGSSADEVVEALEGGGDDGFGDLDLGDDDFEDFGFGDMLAGTKFGDDD